MSFPQKRWRSRLIRVNQGMTTRHLSVFYPDLNNADFNEVLRGLRMAGADVIHTTLAWSQVEREPGKFDFSPYSDIFERLANEGLLFIIAMDFSARIGGVPHWLEK